MISQTPGQGEAAEPSAAIKLVVSTGVVSTDPAEQTVKLQVTVPDTGKQATEDSNPMLELIRGGMDRYA